LFNANGDLAVRPTVVSAPLEAENSQQIPVTHNSDDVISRVTLVTAGRLDKAVGSKGQRFFELEFTDSTDGVNVTLPESANVAPSGYYMMFLINDKGVPSEGHMIKLTGPSTKDSAFPETVSDFAATTHGVTITIDPLANDVGSALTLSLTSDWSLNGGSVSLVDNKITYTPNDDFEGEDKVWYIVVDALGRSNFGVITITVKGGDSDSSPYPTAVTDIATAKGGSTVTIDASANDIGAELTINTDSDWSLNGGNVAVIDNQITYVPKVGFSGEDKIWYTIVDKLGRSNFGVVIITVSVH
jgi:hypothetical protein